jgi:hypothetical protein
LLLPSLDGPRRTGRPELFDLARQHIEQREAALVFATDRGSLASHAAAAKLSSSSATYLTAYARIDAHQDLASSSTSL